MNNSLSELKTILQTRFNNSADLSIRDITLRSDQKITAAVITIEGMVDKEELAQVAVNGLLAYDF